MTGSWPGAKSRHRCATGSTAWTRTVTAYWKPTKSRVCGHGWDAALAAAGVMAGAVVECGATRLPGSARSTATATGGSRVRRSPNRLERMFDRLDANGDDVITEDELNAMTGRMRGGRGR